MKLLKDFVEDTKKIITSNCTTTYQENNAFMSDAVTMAPPSLSQVSNFDVFKPEDFLTQLNQHTSNSTKADTDQEKVDRKLIHQYKIKNYFFFSKS